MMTLGIVIVVALVLIAGLFVTFAIATEGWEKKIPFEVGAFVLLAGTVVLEVMMANLYSPMIVLKWTMIGLLILLTAFLIIIAAIDLVGKHLNNLLNKRLWIIFWLKGIKSLKEHWFEITFFSMVIIIASVTSYYHDNYIKNLVNSLEDRNELISETAKKRLIEIKEEKSVVYILRNIKENVDLLYPRYSSLYPYKTIEKGKEVIVNIGEPATPSLIKALDTNHEEFLSFVKDCLIKISEPAKDSLEKAIKKKNIRIAANAADVLHQIKENEKIKKLPEPIVPLLLLEKLGESKKVIPDS